MKYLHITEKKSIVFNAYFLVKEGTNNKKLDIVLFAYSRGVGNLCFVAVDASYENLFTSRQSDRTRLIFFTKFTFVCSEER